MLCGTKCNLLKRLLECLYVFFFFSLKHKTKGKKAPTISWLSGSFNKQWCDEKHMPTGFCGTEKGGLLPPREPEGQTTLLWGLGTRAAQPTSQLEAVGRQLRQMTLLQAEQPFSPCEAERLAC